ncbi:MAG: YitT family protein [Clostridiales bacterium]|nr:YitT family protein [Candidatus Crickella caballi]
MSKKKTIEQEIKKANDKAAADPKYHGKSKLEVKTTELMLALFGALIYSFATICVMIPNGLTCGGTSGLARMVQHYTGWNFSLISYSFAAVIIAIIWLTLGFKEVRKIVLMSVAYPTMYALFELTHYEIKSDDKLLMAVLCGVCFGICNGLTFKAGYSSGGADSIAKVVKYKKIPHVGLNDITFVISAGIVVISAFVFGVNIALYAMITMFISMKIGDAVMYGSNDKLVQLDVMTDVPELLCDYVMHELGRGVTSVEKVGEYTKETRKQLQILCSPRESFLIKRFLANKDPRSFVTVLRVSSVWGIGRGFEDINEID